jgi:hypothetical protein
VRRDERLLLEHVRLYPLGELRLFEQFDDAKVERLCQKIEADGVFFNPISIVRERIVIDGVNRLEALRRLGGKTVPCVVFDYADVDLLANVHFIHAGRTTRLSEFARSVGRKVEFPKRSPADIMAAAEAGELIPNGETFHRVPHNVIRLPVPLEALQQERAFDLTGFLRERIEQGQVRFYQMATYVCDEW